MQSVFAAYPPQVVLNLTGFALGLDGLDDKQNPFAGVDAPVIQLIQAGRPEAQWAADPQGLSAKDLAMQVVLPELDGRHGMLLVGHKQEAVWHERDAVPALAPMRPDADGIGRAVTLAKNWTVLRATPRGRAERWPSSSPTTPSAMDGWRTAWVTMRRSRRWRFCGRWRAGYAAAPPSLPHKGEVPIEAEARSTSHAPADTSPGGGGWEGGGHRQ